MEYTLALENRKVKQTLNIHEKLVPHLHHENWGGQITDGSNKKKEDKLVMALHTLERIDCLREQFFQISHLIYKHYNTLNISKSS